jgi:hypothetical protein
MAKTVTKDLVKQVMAAMGSRGGKRSLETMTPEERIARAKKASDAATAKRLEAERVRKRGKRPGTKA